MKLSEWADKNSLTYRRAWQLFKEGKIKNSRKIETGTIIVDEDIKMFRAEKTVVYARVSSSENKNNLNKQAERLENFCAAKGWVIYKTVKETGSGLNDGRKQLSSILKDKSITRIVVEHKDRLARFGFNYIKELLELDGREIIVVNIQDNTKDDLMQDFVSIITSFTARLYGQRRTKRKTEQLIKELEKDK